MNSPTTSGAFTTLEDTNNVERLLSRQSVNGDGASWPGTDNGHTLR
jgi:hypothetical protein